MYEIGEKPFFSKMSGPWFDGYAGEEIIFIDDLREDGINYDVLLRLTGGYGNRFPVKGGSVVIRPKVVYVTAPCAPEHMFRTSSLDSIEQLKRRITNLEEFVEEWKPPMSPEGEVDLSDDVCTIPAMEPFTPLRFLYTTAPVVLSPEVVTPLRCRRRTLPSPTQLWDGLVSSDEE